MVASCGDDHHAPALASEADGGAEEEDAGTDSSTGNEDASNQDEDGAAQNDSGANRDYYQFDESDKIEVDVGNAAHFVDQRGFDLTVGATDFALAYENGDLYEGCANRIDFIRIANSGAISKPKTIINADATSCSEATEPTVFALKDSFPMIWSDDRSGGARLYSLGLNPLDKPCALNATENIERHVAVTSVNSQLVAAWVAENPTTGKRAIYSKLLGVADSQPLAVVSEDAGRMPKDLVLTRVGAKKAVLGWVDVNDATRGIFLQRLMADGSAEGEPQQLLGDPSWAYAGSTIDITGADNGGALVYAVAIGEIKQLHFLRVDAEGRGKTETYVKLIAPPRGQAKDGSLVKWGAQQSNQYLVAYRAVADENLAGPEIRTISVDLGVPWEPAKMNPSKISDAASEGGRVIIRVANDGTAMVAWVDAVLSTKKWLRAVRLRPKN